MLYLGFFRNCDWKTRIWVEIPTSVQAGGERDGAYKDRKEKKKKKLPSEITQGALKAP